jgi:hypothetical protein
MNIEKLQRHIAHLQQQHDDLDKLIQEEYNRYQDDQTLLQMKKEKLALKEEINKLTEQLNTA